MVGDQVGYLIGRRFGPRVFSRPGLTSVPAASTRSAPRQFFARHGSFAVVLGSFVPVVRTFVPVVAGVGRMSYHRFTVFNVAGAVVWAIGIMTAGFFFGGIPFVAAHIEVITLAIAGLSVVPAALELLRRRKAARVPVAGPVAGQVAAVVVPAASDDHVAVG